MSVRRKNLPVVQVLPSIEGPVELRALDTLCAQAADGAEDVLQVWAALRPVAVGFVETLTDIVKVQKENLAGKRDAASIAEAHRTMTSLAGLLDKVTRCGTSITKMMDELARLRVFLSGGEDDRALEDLSQNELGQLIKNVARVIDDGKDG